MLRITAKALEEMIKNCQEGFPNEACGYLAGKNGIAEKAYEIQNARNDPSSYEMLPAAQVAVQKLLRTIGLKEMAIYHSHVATEAYPSRRDIDRATAIQDFFDGHYVIVTLENFSLPRARAFTIRDGHVSEEPLLEE